MEGLHNLPEGLEIGAVHEAIISRGEGRDERSVKIKVQLTEDLKNYDWQAKIFEASDESLVGSSVKVHFGNRGKIMSVFS